MADGAGREGVITASSHVPPRPLLSQFWSEGYREGIEEGKKATVQEGFNLGFREGAAAGVAYGQVRGAACSVAIFAGQVPGSSGWKAALAETLKTVDALPTPMDAVKAARVDFERAMAANARGGEPGTPEPGAEGAVEKDEGTVGGGPDHSGEGSGGETERRTSSGGVGGRRGGEGRDGGDGTFIGRMGAAKIELDAAGFHLREFKLT